ncbi:MAG: Periplasmic pH-dependent serine endoprotease DegQ [Acidobacteria bacterium]|nr:Periplasmic pH-dependent serine endoprotease DegQ [Acidobacteriota bacterium]
MNNIQPRFTGKRLIAIAISAALAAAFVLGNVIGSASRRQAPSLIPMVSASNGASGTAALATSFAAVVKSAQPAVVSIASTKVVKTNGADEGLSPLFNDPMFRQFFGQGRQNPFGKPREEREQGLGSGVIVSPDGYILTNNHVIEGASDIKVYTSNNRELKARVIGADPKTDIAVVKVEEKNLPTLAFADSAQTQVGDIALAIGNPFGVGQTVTMGIISATGRGNLGIEDYEDFIQTDAAINPGNSGGALINTSGQLIGVNTAILSRAGGNQGVGFAVPANLARTVMNQLLKNGKVTRGYLGVLIQPITPEIAKAFNLVDARGALVGEVTSGGPAAKAGLAQGDVITELNGARVEDSRELRLKISQMAPGSSAKLKVIRDGAPREISVTLGELPNEKTAASNGNPENSSPDGLSVENLTPQIARQLDLPSNVSGVIVTDVQDGSRADDAGLRRGDVIQQVNRKPVSNTAEFDRAMKQAGGKSVLLLVNRNGHTSFVAIAAQ